MNEIVMLVTGIGGGFALVALLVSVEALKSSKRNEYNILQISRRETELIELVKRMMEYISVEGIVEKSVKGGDST